MANRTISGDPLAALAAHLSAHRLAVELTSRGLRVANPDVAGCCAEVGRASDLITCRAARGLRERVVLDVVGRADRARRPHHRRGRLHSRLSDGRGTVTAPWAVVEFDPERVAVELTRRFPGVSAWWGEFTGRWWAFARDQWGRDRLVEAATPVALAQMLHQIGAGRRPPSRAPVRRADVAACRHVGRPESRRRRPRRRGWFRRAFAF
ncbi:hypothetical protein [Actinomadura nitritigenes]|uniref:hypothetical protein n=1 Tax=Actinomadura nitritigenes TaxID=134602 RepID=UPI003D93DC87